MKASIPEELEMKMAKLTEGHSEPLDTTNRSLIGNDVGVCCCSSHMLENLLEHSKNFTQWYHKESLNLEQFF